MFFVNLFVNLSEGSWLFAPTPSFYPSPSSSSCSKERSAEAEGGEGCVSVRGKCLAAVLWHHTKSMINQAFLTRHRLRRPLCLSLSRMSPIRQKVRLLPHIHPAVSKAVVRLASIFLLADHTTGCGVATGGDPIAYVFRRGTFLITCE